jgi:hypothetical protein
MYQNQLFYLHECELESCVLSIKIDSSIAGISSVKSSSEVLNYKMNTFLAFCKILFPLMINIKKLAEFNWKPSVSFTPSHQLIETYLSVQPWIEALGINPFLWRDQ